MPMIKSITNKNVYKYLFLLVIFTVYCLTTFKIAGTGYFIWDDRSFLFEPVITASNWFQAISSSHYGLYHPVTTLFVKINYLLHGNTPEILHIENLFIHCCNSLLVLIILNKLGLKGYIGFILFLFHPLTCEVAFWITSIKDLLFCFFGFSSIVLYLTYLKQPQKRFYYFITLTLVSFSLLSKIQVIFLPFVLLIFDLLVLKRISFKSFLNKIPMLIIGGLIFLVNLHFRSQEADLTGLPVFPFYERIIIATSIFIKYLVALIIPVRLSIFYPFEPKPSLIYPLFFIIYGVILLFSFKLKNKELQLILILLFICLLPVLQLLPIRESERNDRYTYFAVFILSLSIEFIYKNLKNKPARLIATISALIYLIMIGSIFIHQTGLWKNQKQLFISSYENFPKSEILANTIGVIYLKENNKEKSLEFLDRSIQLEPTFAQAFYNKGLLFEKFDQQNEAISSYKKAISLHTSFPDAIFRLSQMYYLNQQTDSASMFAEMLVRISEEDISALELMGKIEYQKGDVPKSIFFYKKALKIDADNYVILFNLAVSFGSIGDYYEALEALNKCIKINPSFHQAYYLRGLTKNKLGLNGCEDLLIAVKKGNQNAIAALKTFCNY